MESNKIQAFLFKKIGDNYQFLLLKRIVSRGDFWQPITGRAKKNENLLKAAKREVEEETGITNFRRVIENIYSFNLEEDPSKKEVVFAFEVAPENQIFLDTNKYLEHDEFRWCSYEEAISLLKWPQNKEAIKKLNEIIIS